MSVSFDFFFSKTSFQQKELFQDCSYFWDVLEKAPLFLQSFHFSTEKKTYPNVVMKGNVAIGKNVKIDPFVYIEGPVVIGNNVWIKHGAYLRSNTILNDGVVIGHATEIKHSVVGKNTVIAHLNYVGDSIIGKDVHLASHVVCANQRLDKRVVLVGQKKVSSHRKKLGAMIGDNVSIGCHIVLNPGTTVERGKKLINKQRIEFLKEHDEATRNKKS